MLRVELETSLQSLSDRRFSLSCHTLPSDAPEACLSNAFPVPVLQSHCLVLFQEPGVPLRFLLVLISNPQYTGGTYSRSILRLHSTGFLYLLFRGFLSQLSSPSPNGRQTLTHSGERACGLPSVLPVLTLQQAVWEVSALLALPTPTPDQEQWGSLLPLSCGRLILPPVQRKSQKAEAFLLVLIYHTETTADLVYLLLTGCTSQFSCPYPVLSHDLSNESQWEKDEERVKIPLVSRTPRNSKLLHQPTYGI